MIFKALSGKKRWYILRVLLWHEGKRENAPMSYTELKDRLRNMSSGKLTYHLDQLQEAGLVRQLTKLSMEDATAENRYRSFYQTTPLLTLILRVCRAAQRR